MKNKHIIILMVFTILLAILPELLRSVSAEENDLVFVISLYEHGQYDLAKKQIAFFEMEYKHSAHARTITFMKAKITFFEKNFTVADSLYSMLLNENIDNEMLYEVLINKAEIRYEWKDHIQALGFLSRSERATNDPQKKYQIEFLRGRIQTAMFNLAAAQQSYEKALIYKKNDAAATNELLKSYISSNDIGKARALAKSLIEQPDAAKVHTSAINNWLDYLIGMEEYAEALKAGDFLFMDNTDSIKLRMAKINYLIKDFNKSWELISQTKSHSSFKSYLMALLYIEQGKDSKADSIFATLSQGKFTAADVLPDSKENLAVMSWLERIKILYKSNPDLALKNLDAFLAGFAKEEQNPNVLYVYSSLLFKSKRYQDAINALLLVRKLNITPELNHNVQAMLGDIWFNAKIPDNAKQAYNNYLNMYPHGKFRAHALYNIALINFEQKNYEESSLQLNSIILSENDAEIIEKSKYLQAEISFFQSNYTKAIEQYLGIKADYLDQVIIDYRIAQCLYYMENYQAAAEYIPKLLKETENAFQIMILQGNIYFNLKRYNEALDVYNQAFVYAKNDFDRQEANSYKALTLYRLRRFTEATALYLKLSQEEETPQAYLIMAAKASYHAKEYQQALILFQQFVNENPTSDNYNYALANIGNIYYNLGEQSKAINTWIELLKRYKANKFFTEDEQVILSSVFSGMLYSFQLSPNQKALTEIDSMVDTFDSDYIKFELQYLLLKVYFGGEQWSDIIDMADKLRTEFPNQVNNEIRRYAAASLAKLDRKAEADSIYQQVFTLEPNADILTEWAELEIQSEKYQSAVSKLDQALIYDLNDLRFVKLLQVLYDFAPDSLDVYWNKWQGSFNIVPDKAQRIWMLWNYTQKQWVKSEQISRSLLLNPDYQIRSQAQFILGASLFYQKNYEQAVLELYKTIYLYPESAELMLDAKRLIIYSYINSNQLDEARKVLAEIRDFLTDSELQEFNTILNVR